MEAGEGCKEVVVSLRQAEVSLTWSAGQRTIKLLIKLFFIENTAQWTRLEQADFFSFIKSADL